MNNGLLVSDAALAAQMQGKMGYQEKVCYCKDCVWSAPNPAATERYSLVCNKNSLLTFPTMKMSTCAMSDPKPKPKTGDETPDQEPPEEDPGEEIPFDPDPELEE